MAAKQSSCFDRIIATVFTSLVAPTIVALFTSAMKDGAHQDTAGTAASMNRPSAATTTASHVPTVTLLPPALAEVCLPSKTSTPIWQAAIPTSPTRGFRPPPNKLPTTDGPN